MGYIALAVLILTLVAWLFGGLFGLMRGLNRSLLRLGLIVLCVVLAILLRGVFVDLVMGINVGDGTIEEMIASAFVSEEMEMPPSVINLVFALVEIVIGIAVYYVLFFVLRFITWVLFYPILKIWVKKGEKKRGWWGALVGFGQGLIIAFAMWAPLTGLLVNTNKVLTMEMDGKQVVEEVPEEIGLAEYPKSVPGAVYNVTGGWYFEILGTTKDAEGKTVRLSDVCDIVVTVMDMANSVADLGESMENMRDENASEQDYIDTTKEIGQKLIEIDGSIDKLSTGSKTIINDLIGDFGEMMGEEWILPDDFTVDTIDFGSAGEGLCGIATYVEKVSPTLGNGQVVTQDDVDSIVNGFGGCLVIFDMLMEGEEYEAWVPVLPEHEAMFEASINATEFSDGDKAKLRALCGL